MNIVELINKKRLKENLSFEELDYIINAYLKDEIKDYQMSALLMSICLNGMSDEETSNLTKIMLNSGEKLDLSSIAGVKVDKHSTGGVGDKTTLIIVPMVASCGVIVPKMSGRSLGHTGGTADKLESIPGIKIALTIDEIIKQLKDIGAVMTTSSLNIVPADKKIYALRDVTGTVSSIPLMASSIMSKKLAIGADKILLDVKVGNGAYMTNLDDAKALARTMVNIGNSFNKETVAIITNMDYPLGSNIGNALEIEEAKDILQGKVSNDLKDLCITLASYMVSLGKSISLEEAQKLVVDNLNNGKAYEKFLEIINYQQGDINGIKISDTIIEVKTNQEGYINNINALVIGELSMALGAGRINKEDVVDSSVGIVLTKAVGDYVKVDDVIAKLYIGNKQISNEAVLKAFAISSEPIAKEPLIIDVIK